jgi:hypothetical protein
VCYVGVELPEPATPLPFVASFPGDWAAWLRDEDVPERTPVLISPTFEYDVELNAFFRSAVMVCAALHPSWLRA